MSALVSVCTASGALRRYEPVGDGTARLTHEAIPDAWGTGNEWESGCIETMRANPPTCFAVTETPLLKPVHDAPWRVDPNDAA